jgi:THO complex subunit 1
LLSDLFDCRTIEQCEQLFDLVEKRVHIWKEELFFKNVKNQLLRSCNDLLRRLSKSQNTVFCGRILIFLARFFPLFERSGLNLISEFNHENSIQISREDEGVFDTTGTVSMEEELILEEGEMVTTSDRVDFQFYLKFWSLQEYFRLPTICYNRPSWKTFQSNANDVIALFTVRKLENQECGLFSGLVTNQSNFSKYLTNQKLLELQLADSNFRRYVLIQFLILFQYLIGRVRFKSELQVLSDDQLAWVNETSDRVLTLIEDTPPNGRQMRECITQLLTREQFWSNWKNEACSELKTCNQKPEVNSETYTKQKIGDEIRSFELSNRMVIGNQDLTKLWNVCPDNWDSCKAEERSFMPNKREYFEKVMKAPVEYQDIFLNDANFTWRSLRVLSQQSTHFFPQSNQALQPVKKYLAEAIKQLRSEFKIEQVVSESVPDTDDLIDRTVKRKLGIF